MAEMSPDSGWPRRLCKDTVVEHCPGCRIFKDSAVLVPSPDSAPNCECGGLTGASEEGTPGTGLSGSLPA